jgi:hypothetical protein
MIARVRPPTERHIVSPTRTQREEKGFSCETVGIDYERAPSTLLLLF